MSTFVLLDVYHIFNSKRIMIKTDNDSKKKCHNWEINNRVNKTIQRAKNNPQ